ncbi:hypothetical protein Sjap_022653 [Stephania japonica]|uniref:Uncharacterized protein n=1 Tax=Stephania japonica TaxID=461633 RepID=A0AAP0HUL4_9MAGN
MDKGKSLLTYQRQNKFFPLFNQYNNPASNSEQRSSYQLRSYFSVYPLDYQHHSLTLDNQINVIIPNSHNFIVRRPNISMKFYEALLSQTGSVIFYHFKKPNSEEIAYSKFKIQRVLSSDEWFKQHGLVKMPCHFHQPIALKNIRHTEEQTTIPISYNDYIEARKVILFYKKSAEGHSWYITYKKSIGINFPPWFHHE